MPAVALPTPRTWATGQIVKVPYLRADVADAVALLAQPPLFTGAQTTTAQPIASGATDQVLLDTELTDNFYGHLDNVPGNEPAEYYAMFPGWYLTEFTVPLNYTGGNGAVEALAGAVSNGGAFTAYGGQRVLCSGTSGQYSQPAVAKLLQMVQTGTYGSTDYIAGVVNHTAGASEHLLNSPTQYPLLKCLWVAASTGTAGLGVPSNPAWPTPPSYVTSSWMNSYVRNTIQFLIYPPIMEAYYSAGGATLASQASIPTTGTTVPLDTKTVDNYGAFSTSTHTWTAPVAGVYYAYAQCGQTGDATSIALGAGLTVTSANYNSGTTCTLWGGTQAALATSGAGNTAIARRRLRLNAGDTVKAAGWQYDSSGSAATLSGSNNSRLIMAWRNA